MGDSDEEYDRRRARDKFRRERSDYQERRGEDRGRRDDWSERDRGGRREYRDYDARNRRDRYSPVRHDISPPMKRMRRDWEDRGGGYGGNYDGGFPSGGGGGGPHGNWGMHHNQQREMDIGLTQPPMMTFKQFLASQDDGIDDQEAVKKYNEYKLEFKRQQLNEFFLNHKDEEWFKIKYHPEESTKRKAELTIAQKNRLDVFMDFYGKTVVDAIKLDQENTDQIIRFLDSVVIKLEGGTDFDLKALDEPLPEQVTKDSMAPLVIQEPKKIEEPVEKKLEPVDEAEKEKDSDFVDNDGSSAVSDSDSDSQGAMEEGEANPESKNDKQAKKKDRKTSESLSEKDSNVTIEKEEDSTNKSDMAEKEEDSLGVDAEKEIPEKEARTDKEDGDDEESADMTEKVESTEEAKTESVEETTTEGAVEVEEPPKPRPLHVTCSIFLRYLAPSITKQEVEAMCKRFPGFLRVAIADPQLERRFVRKAWVTFERSVNIKEMCWNLNGIRLRDSELGALVNRDLSRRIRSVNGISSHKQVVRADIKLAARIVQNLDRQKKLWSDDEEKEITPEHDFKFVSKNPLMKNITDYLIEEASAEEEELLGTSDQDENKNGEEGFSLERDETLIKVLDRLLLYLRVVHSVDYYNNKEYPNEDEMPNRCGIMHARGSPPSSKVTQQEINDYISHFEQKSQSFLQMPEKMDEEECQKLGKKDPATETEKFIQANTQELLKDKWLCPLSGKKFKGPEFVRKHIFNKHGEKIEEVKKEVEYFNNYLLDSKRPQLPEHPSNRPPMVPGGRGDMHGGIGHPFQGQPFPPPPPPYGFGPRGPGGPNFGFNQNYNRGPDMYRGSGFGKRNYNRRNQRSDLRKIITYRDLDAPNDMDTF